MKTLEVIEQIKKIAESNAKRAKSQKTRFLTEENFKVGDVVRQGDLYLFRVPLNFKVGAEIKRNQIADGVSLGARHILNGEFVVYEGENVPKGVNDSHARAGLGYAFDAKESTVLGHPEHDNYVVKMDKCRIQVMHQVDLRTLMRVSD